MKFYFPVMKGKRCPLGEFQQRLLLETIDRNVGTITLQKCAAWYRFMQTYLPRCTARLLKDNCLLRNREKCSLPYTYST